MISKRLAWLPAVALALVAASGCEKSAPVVSYQRDVAPILDKHCKSCHLPGQAGYVVSGFELAGYESLMKGTQFGPVVLLGFGGVHVEALSDVAYALPPFDATEARRLLDRLRLRALLDSPRHVSPLALDEFCAAAARFSSLVAGLADALGELDLNPVIVHADGCTIVDALLVGRRAAESSPAQVRQAV
jgi:hypothetical protein